MRKCILVSAIILFIVTLMNITVLAANSTLEGNVKDANTGEPLFGANVIIVGTSMGAVSDAHGKYKIQNVIPGFYKIRASYIGYVCPEIELTINEDSHIHQDFVLKPVGLESNTIEITAQASGQKQAINKQLTSDQIVNVVSAAKIQELPDANAAESVGRLPGVSILRSGGEGTEVVIRGLEPKYNAIQIDGIKMSSSNASDRSTDLSMISPNMLDGIEVSKTVTADMDADVLGGTVNFELHEAKASNSGVPVVGLLAKGGYNNLSNAYNKLNNYKYIISAEDRYFDDCLGIFAQVDIERKNLTSNELGASYGSKSNSDVDYVALGLNLYNIPRDKTRYNGAIVMDYRLPEGKIKFSNFFSSGNTDYQNRAESFYISSNQHLYSLGSYHYDLSTITNSINFQQQLPIFSVDLKLSHSYSQTKTPDNWYVSFLQNSAGLNQFTNVANLNPIEIPQAANNNFSNTNLTSIVTYESFSKERSLVASLDLKRNISFSDLLSAEIKFGGKYRYQKRSYTYDEYDQGAGSLEYGGAKYVDNMITSYFSIPVNSTSIPITYFTDPSYDYGEFLGGDYLMVSPLNLAMLDEMTKLLKRNVRLIEENGAAGAYGHHYARSTTNNYSGYEDLSAFYIMSTFKIGEEITFIPGVRYQNLKTSYTGVRGVENPASYKTYNHYDTTLTKNHGYWLPNFSLRYKPLSWFDVRLSYTNTLAYPDFQTIVPRINVSVLNSIDYNNADLVPSRSKNYDLYFSFYDNSIGLLTAGAFLKKIDNLIYYWSFNVFGTKAQKYYPYSASETANSKTQYSVNTYLNNSYVVNNYGMELDWQTHFWYLPEPLSGLVFSVNYTHIFSKAKYPYETSSTNGRTVVYVDTFYVDRLIGQPNDIVNLSLGFDYQKFSVRVSMLYQADIFTGPNIYPQLRSYTSAYTRWDLAVKQELPWFGIQIFGNINNVNGAYDVSVIKGGGVPTSKQDYGMTADIGLRCNL